MSDVPLLVSVEEMLATAKLQLVDIRFDRLSIDLVDDAPQAGSDLEGSEPTLIEITACSELGRKANASEHGLSSGSRLHSGRLLSQSLPTMRGVRSLFSPPKRLLTLHRKLRSWRRFLTFVKPSVI